MSTSALQNPMLQTPSSLRAVLLSEPEARLPVRRRTNPPWRAPSSHASGFFNPRVLLAFAFCSVGVFLAALGFASTPTPAGWSLITAANTSATQTNYLNGVTCASASDCWAVGYYLTGGSSSIQQTLIEHWNGSSWAVVTSPNADTTHNNALSAVRCASASECWAVGSYNNGSVAQTLIERWNGTSWALVASPNNGTLGNALSGVTCTSASECWAAGSYVYATGDLSKPSALGTLIEHWTASSNSWGIVSSPNQKVSFCGLTCAIFDNYLVAVTCASAADCWAVGSYGGGENATLLEHWDGTSWALVTSPDANTAGNDVLNGVTCASAADCWAVGSATNGESSQTHIEHWNGTSWAIVTSLNPSPSALSGVTCTSASECWAVGYYGNGSVAQTLIEQWNGTSWSIATSPNTSAAVNNVLNGVTCTSASGCWAVGYYAGSSATQTLIEEFAPTIPPLTGVASRMTHGSAGTFDINLPLTGPRGVECRSSASLGAGNYTVVFSFVNNVTSCGTASTGSLSSGPGSNQCTVNLTGVANQQYLTVTLSNVLDSQANTGNVAATMGVLIGDVNANGTLTNADVSLVKAQVASGAGVGLSNFRDDINANGLLSNADVSLTKAQVAAGAQLPTPP